MHITEDQNTDLDGFLNKAVRPVYLYLGFAFYMLAFVGVSFYTYQSFSASSSSLIEEIKNNDLQSTTAMKMRVAVRERAILLWQMTVQSDPFERDELFLRFREFGARYQNSRAVYLNTILSPVESEMIKRLDNETAVRAPMLRNFAESLMDDSGVEVYTQQLNQTLTNQVVVANILDEIIYQQKLDNQLAHEDNIKKTEVHLYQLIIVVSLIIITGIIFGWIVVNSISKQRHYLFNVNQELHRLARRDVLTGLQNRMSLMEHLELNYALVKRHQQLGALLFIDLDGFKDINDRYGHDIGDLFLIEVGKQMLSLRDSDVVARLGGDEFVVVLLNIEKKETAYLVAEKLLEKLSATYQLGGHSVSASASIGICFFPDKDMTVDELLSCADNAMYEAKHNGKNAYAVVSPE